MKKHRSIALMCTTVFAAWVLGSAGAASGCSCLPLSTQEMFDRADFVVQATVTCRTVPDPHPAVVRGDTMMVTTSSDMVLYAVQVSRVWKGHAEIVDQVYSARDSGFCGYHFQAGREYLIFGRVDDYRDRSWMWACDPEFPVKLTGICDGTQEIGSAADALGFLGQPLHLLGESQ